MAEATTDYDHVDSFHVAPDDLVTHGNNIKNHNQDIADSLTNIVNVLSALQLGWAGKTAEEAKDFGDKWDAVATELFGTKDHPEQGVLNTIVGGVLTVADLFSRTDNALFDFFNHFAEDLGGSGGGARENITDPTKTAVTETWA